MHTYTVFGCISAAALVFGIASCSDDEGPPDQVTGGNGAAGPNSSASATASTGTSAGGGDPNCGETACAPPEPTQPNEMVTFGVVTAQVVDQDDMPAQNVNAPVCGINLCGDIVNSDAQGNLSVDGQNLSFIAPRFSVGYNGRGYTKLTSLISMTDFGTIRVVRLPQFSAGADLVGATEATNSGVTLGLAADSEIKFDCLTFTDPAERKFVAATVDVSTWTAAEAPFIDQSLDLEVIVALGPLDTHICPAASLTFANVRNWAMGANVEIYIHGTKTYQHYAPYGSWAKIADAVVGADGVATVQGQGIEVLGTYGARLAP